MGLGDAPSAQGVSDGVPDARTLGVWVLVALALVLASGLPMAFVYDADPSEAHVAAERLSDGAWGVLRGAHAWAASATIALGLVHVARGYVAARVGTIGRARALGGLTAFGVVVAAYFLGTVLPWDQQGWEAYQHLQAAWEAVGVGTVSNDPSATPLGLVFWLHVLAVPLVLGAALLWHLGGAAGPGAAARRAWTWTRHRWRSATALVGLTVAAGVLWPPELGPAPLARLFVAKPDWPFLWLVPLQDWFGPVALWSLPLLFVGAGALVWRGVAQGLRVRRIVLAVVAVVFVVLTLLGAS